MLSLLVYWIIRASLKAYPMGLRLWRIPQDLRIIRRGGGEGGALDRPDVNSSFSDDGDDDTVRIGILGASNIAKFAVLWPALKDTAAENVVVHAVASRDGAKARKYADSAGIPNAYEGYQKVLEDPKVDAVYIGLPSELHFMWAKRAILAGKHVLVEKPLTLNYHEAEVLRDLIASQERYNHQNQEEVKEETALDRTKNKKTKKKKKKKKKRVVGDSDGNVVTVSPPFSSSTNNNNNISEGKAEEDDNDDLFGASPPKPTTSYPPTTTGVGDRKDHNGGGVDIRETSVVKVPEKKKKKKKKKKERKQTPTEPFKAGTAGEEERVTSIEALTNPVDKKKRCIIS
mmetsp:Transcript_39997/g.64141  ORF Transcript_39997/g.64141 Transcript_39997/m.64141 type:complete len:343 (+) Transcript_39997:313-1341(+)